MSQESRRAQLHALMDRVGVDAILLRRPPNFAWYTNGADNRVDHSAPFGVADAVVTRDRDFILTNNIEAARLHVEEVPGFEIVHYPWYEDPLPTLRRPIGDMSLGADAPFEDARDLTDQVARVRWVLDEDARARYAEVGRDAETALSAAASTLRPGITEREAAAAIAEECSRAGLFAPVILAAADDRISAYRHPLPQSNRAERRLMLVLCAERGGLFANLTQFVHFEEPSPDLRARFEACERILERMREATTPGRTLAQVLADTKRFYAEEGFPNEWTLHHQGGTTGYASREVVATPDTHVPIEIGQAFAWNPSITGAKAEETFVLDADGPKILSRGSLLP